jgi:retinol dehydrogenase-12
MLNVSSFVGGNAGVGKETVKVRYRSIQYIPFALRQGSLIAFQQLLLHNAKVYLAARSAQKANEAIAELKNETGKSAIFLQLDLSDIPAVRKSAQEFLSYVPIRASLSQGLQ